MLEQRKINVMFQKGGSGSVTTRLAIPKKWVDHMEITQEEREVIVEFDGESITVRKMNEADKLIQKIDNAIEKEMMATGRMGAETVTVSVSLTDEENNLFHDIQKYDSEHYFWEIEENELTISYTEDV